MVVSSAQDTEPGSLDIAQITQGLGASRLATIIHYFPEIGSTNSYAKERAESGAGEGEVVVAESQSQGRGRLGSRRASAAAISPGIATFRQSLRLDLTSSETFPCPCGADYIDGGGSPG